MLVACRATRAAQRALRRAARPPVRHAARTMVVKIPDLGNNNPHYSNAEELIAKVPVIKVAGGLAMCNGGGGALGHPIEYITLNTTNPTKPSTCLYCGLRYVKDPDAKHAH